MNLVVAWTDALSSNACVPPDSYLKLVSVQKSLYRRVSLLKLAPEMEKLALDPQPRPTNKTILDYQKRISSILRMEGPSPGWSLLSSNMTFIFVNKTKAHDLNSQFSVLPILELLRWIISIGRLYFRWTCVSYILRMFLFLLPNRQINLIYPTTEWRVGHIPTIAVVAQFCSFLLGLSSISLS